MYLSNKFLVVGVLISNGPKYKETSIVRITLDTLLWLVSMLF